MGWRAYEDRKLPRHEGRNLRSWFEEECRVTSSSEGLADSKRELECKLAILAMGTNAVPFLVDQAMSGREDGLVRRGLRQVLGELSGSRWNRWIVPFAHVQGEAAWLVGPLKPPADLLLPRVLPYLHSSNERQRIQGLSLLGSVGDGAEKVLPLLLEALEHTKDPWVRAATEASIHNLGTQAVGALDRVLAAMDPSAVNLHLPRWMAGLGPVASNAVPVLEGIMGSELNGARYEALVALLNIRPDHPGALSLMRETLSDGAGSTPRAQAAREELSAAWVFAPRRPHAEAGTLLEPLARLDIRTWTANNANYRTTRGLERVAPERAAALYRQALDGPGWIHAAIGLLRLDPNDPVATRRLVEATQAFSEEGVDATLGLREAGSSNAEAIRALQQLARRSVAPEEPMLGMKVRNAEYALARIRYREWMQAAGFDKPDW